MLDESGLAKAFWGECLVALVHVWNRCPTDVVKKATPYELWHGRKPDVSHLRVWGCTAKSLKYVIEVPTRTISNTVAIYTCLPKTRIIVTEFTSCCSLCN